MPTSRKLYLATRMSLVALPVALAGCAASGETVALVGALASGGIYIGSQAATHSKVDVQVEVYKQGDKDDGNHFQQELPLAITRQVGSPRSIDPTVQPSKQAFVAVSEQLDGTMTSLASTQKALADSTAHLKGNTAAKQVYDDLSSFSGNTLAAISKWNTYKETLRDVLMSLPPAGELSSGQATKLSASLQDLRDALGKIDDRAYSQSTFGFLDNEILASINEFRDDKVSSYFDSRIPKSSNTSALTQISEFTAAAVETIGANLKNQAASADYGNLAKTLLQIGIPIRPEDLQKAYHPNDDASTLQSVSVLVNPSRYRPELPFQAASLITADAQIAQNATYNKLDTDVNLGGIRDEVMQSLFTSDAIPDITNKNNEGNWQPMSHATSEGTTGNHDVVIYFENLGLPILKSSAFDPSQFLVANGQMFRKAFSAMASVYGVPQGNVSTNTSTGVSTMGYNISLAQQSRQTAVTNVNSTQTKILNALDSITKADDAAAKTPASTQPAEDAATAIQSVIDALGKTQTETKQ